MRLHYTAAAGGNRAFLSRVYGKLRISRAYEKKRTRSEGPREPRTVRKLTERVPADVGDRGILPRAVCTVDRRFRVS